MIQTVKVDAAAVVGVPVMLPAALSVRPAGSVPLAIDQLYGEIASPLAVRVPIDCTDCPTRNDAVVTDSATNTVM